MDMKLPETNSKRPLKVGLNAPKGKAHVVSKFVHQYLEVQDT